MFTFGDLTKSNFICRFSMKLIFIICEKSNNFNCFQQAFTIIIIIKMQQLIVINNINVNLFQGFVTFGYFFIFVYTP